MYSLERRTSSRTRTQRKTIYDEAISLDNKKRKRKVTTSSGSSNGRKRSITTKSATEANGGDDDFFGEEDFGGPEYRLDLDNKTEKEKVKETLRLYNTYYLRIAQLEEKRCGRTRKDAPKGSKSQQKKGNSGESSAATSGKTVMRADLKTSKMMKLTNTFLHPQNLIGALPGIDVGDHFLTRGEMVVLGLHDHWMNGIGYISKSCNEKVEERYRNCTFPLAVSVVISGKYKDNMDNGDDIYYTGQGGNNTKGDCRQNHNQKMERGNLALQNNIGQDVPVRVIRGHKSKSSDGKPGMTYTYDGLYKVVNSWPEKGASGFNVYKFHLKRIQGQPQLTTKQVTYCRGHVPKGNSELPGYGLVCEDISDGQERIPIPVTNLIDLEKPTGFKYRKSMVLAKNVKLPERTSGCGCKGKCTDFSACACGKLDGKDFPYVSSNGGRLVMAKSVVYECGPLCGCDPDCANKSSQRGIKYRLEVFRTPAKGWGVKTRDFIPIGAPVCEYTGFLMRSEDVDNTDDADYMFDIDALQTLHGVEGRKKRIGDAETPSYPHTETEKEKSESSDSDEEMSEKNEAHEKKLKIGKPEFVIDARKIGNVARFINHSCDGNLYVQSVLSSHEDVKLARIMLYASDNIPPLQELTYDYGYEKDSVLDANGNIRVMKCHCGAADCRGRVC